MLNNTLDWAKIKGYPCWPAMVIMIKIIQPAMSNTFVRRIDKSMRIINFDLENIAKIKRQLVYTIDEVDYMATKRFDASTSADREVQRVLIELLNQMDGFDQNKNVKSENKITMNSF